MKKFLSIIKGILRDFILNSFWKSWGIIVIIFLSLVLNALLWYIFMVKIKVNPVPCFFASGLILLNLLLANYLWEREKLASFFLVSVGILTQILMLIFIRYLMMIF